MDEKRKILLKSLPKIDEIILLLEKKDIYALAPREVVVEMVRQVVQDLREKIVNDSAIEMLTDEVKATNVSQLVEKSLKD